MSFVIYCPSATVGSIVKHYRTPKRDVRAVFGPSTRLSRRLVHSDGRNRLSQLWTPSRSSVAEGKATDAHSFLVKAGILRQAHSGVFHLLPLGLRIQRKIEKLLQKHLRKLGASEVSLASISSEELWEKSGRFEDAKNELYLLRNRSKAKMLLSPTHEEEITTMVADSLRSYKELPLRLYQISHKYRHELRPRGGLLRTREFVMKDLYTFDFSPHAARKTYDEVKKVYCSFFDELKIPYVISEAGTGVMGGDVSHEFHYLTDSGEDVLFICDTCKYTANEEIVEKRPESYDSTEDAAITSEFSIFTGLSHDRRFLINAFYPKTNSSSYDDLHPRERIDIHALKKAAPSLDLSRRSPMQNWIGWMDEKEAQDQKHPYLSLPEIINVFDHRLSRNLPSRLRSSNWAVLPHSLRTAYATNAHVTDIKGYDTANNPINLQRAEDGDGCPRCAKGTLRSERAVEVGHNFHLGTRYSEPLGAYTVIPRALAKDVDPKRACRGPEIRVPLQMGCHGIGVSRLMAAIAVKRSTSDKNTNVVSLEWPRHVAPFDVAIIHGDGLNEPMTAAYDSLAGPAYGSASGSAHDGPLDVVIDDRPFSMSWKLGDAFAMGYPVVLILGTKWEKSGKCEVFCNALDNFKQEVSLGELNATVSSLLVRL